MKLTLKLIIFSLISLTLFKMQLKPMVPPIPSEIPAMPAAAPMPTIPPPIMPAPITYPPMTTPPIFPTPITPPPAITPPISPVPTIPPPVVPAPVIPAPPAPVTPAEPDYISVGMPDPKELEEPPAQLADAAVQPPIPGIPLPPIPGGPPIHKITPPTEPSKAKKVEKEKKKEEKEPEKDIYLNFENTELRNFVNYIAEQKKINLIPDKAMTGVKISLNIREPLTIDGAWNIFLTILEMSGFSIIKTKEVYKIILKDRKLMEPLPTFINVPEAALPSSDLTIRYVKFLQNIGVNEIRDLLASMLGIPHTVIAQPEVNGVIITDKSYNIKSAMKVINELDQTGLQESVSILRLKQVNASDVKTLFDNLIKKPEGSPLARLLGRQAESNIEYFAPSTRIIAEDRTNSLILLGNQNSIKKIEDFIINHIDTELKGTESPLHVFELQYTDASQIKDILQDITTPPDSPAGQQAAKYGAVRGGVKYFRPMSFQVDKDGNRLIVSSIDKQDWKMLKQTIKDLDKPQPQVAIESMFVDVDITDNKEFGGGITNKKTGQIGKGVDFQGPTFAGKTILNESNKTLLGNLIEAVDRGVGATILSLGSKSRIWAFLEAKQSQETTSILTQPFITIANNSKATIESGSTRRIQSEKTGTRVGYIPLKASTAVTLKPQINLDGIIRFEVNVAISDFVGTGGDTKSKNVTTNVTVADGQVLVLGGFVKTKVTEAMRKTPVLGDIPVLGWFFKYKKRVITKQYTFIFIAPTLIKPRKTPGMGLYTKMKLDKVTREIDEAVQVKRVTDPIHNVFFNPEGEDYSHKVVDFANARYQPTTVDIKNDPYYRAQTERAKKEKIKKELEEKKLEEKELEEKEKLKEEQSPIDEKYLSERRSRLKELISTQSTRRKANKLKKIISQAPQAKQYEKYDPNIEKKEQLKELLSHNQIEENKIKNNLKQAKVDKRQRRNRKRP